MDRFEKIIGLKKILSDWLEAGALLKENFSVVERHITQEKFTDAKTIDLLRKNLFNWIADINLCRNLYLELFKESLPDKLADVSKILDAEEKKIREEKLFRQAEKFLLFVTTAEDLKKNLDEHQSQLKKWLAKKKQNMKIKNFVEPYAKFVDAVEEKDIGKRFSASNELREFFSDDLIGRGLFGNELNFSVAVEEVKEKIPPTPKQKAIIPSSVNIPLDFEEPSPPVPVTPTPAVGKEGLAKILVDNGAILTEEDFAEWKKIFILEKNERNKEFSAVRYKREFENAELIKPVLKYVSLNGILAWPSFCPKKMPKDIMKGIAQLLMNKGYIQRYSFGEYGEFYGITRNFAEFVRTDNGKKFIDYKHGKIDIEKITFIAEEPKYALVRLVYCAVYDMEHGHGSNINEIEFSPPAFRAEFVDKDKRDLILGCFWDTNENCENFLRRLKSYFRKAEKFQRLIVTGLNVQHASKMFNALEEILAGDFPKDVDCYIYDFGEDTSYIRGASKELIPTYIWQGTSEPAKPSEVNSETESFFDEEPEEFFPAPKIEEPTLDADIKEKILSDVKRMLLKKKFYCATAYLKAMSLKLKAAEPLYRQLAFAVDDPLLNEGYSANAISTLATQDSDAFNEALIISAAVRALFYNDFGVDYGVPALNALINNFMLVKSNAALAELIGALKKFKTACKKGVDLYADYQTKDRQAAEENLDKIIRDAEDYYTRFFGGRFTDKADNKTFIRLKKVLFSRNGDLAQIFNAVKDKTEARSVDSINLVKYFLTETFLKKDAGFSRVNIDTVKLKQFVADNWNAVCNEKNPGKLTGELENNITKTLERGIEIMCAWVNCAEIICSGGEDKGNVEYQRIRSRLIYNAQNAQKILPNDAGTEVLARTLKEISARLEGKYSRLEKKYFYAEFLCSDKVILDENYLPNFDLNISDGTNDNIDEQINRHAALQLPSFEERIEQIFEAGGDDFLSARLIDDYLKEVKGASFIDKKEYDVAKIITSAEKDVPRHRENFIGGLELAQSYGQFDALPEGEKEKILQLVENCYKYAAASKNFGVFFRVKKYWEDVIEENAVKRGELLKKDLQAAVESYKKVAENFDAAELAECVAEIEKIISARNCTAAQSLILKLSRGELYKKFDDTEDTPLNRFLDVEEYIDCYNKVKDSGDSLENLIGKKISPRDKVSRAKINLVKNWITNSIGEDKIKTLLELLGFSVEQVKKISLPNANPINFRVKIFNSGQKYSHPIAAFGSDAEISGFNVSCLFGKFDEKNLIEKFKEFGNSRPALVFLDYALDLPTRRRLAKEVKLEQSLTKVFAVVDRVAIMYLLKNCAAQIGTKRITDTLMSLIMPFARCQPYIWSPRIPLPPEMFIGRENEINEVMNHGGVNIVCGGRQLGKSALLKMVCRKVDGNNNERAIFLDIDDKNYREAALLTSRELSDKKFFTAPFETDDWEELARAIRNRLSDDQPTKIPYFLLMLDEADKFIASCAENNYAPIVALAKIQQEDYNGSRFKFVIAGLRNIIRFEREKTFGNNSILPTLKSLTIKPFNIEEARKLLEVPLRYLGLYFPENKKDSLILTILETANYFPSLIQLYCEKLVKALFEPGYAGYDADTPVYRISEEHIKKVLADKDFTKDIKTKIEITLRLGEDKYYFVIANLLAHLYYKQNDVDGYSPRDILNNAETFGLVKEPLLPNSAEKVGALMEELCELNILRKTSSDKYLFSRQRILRIIGNLNEVEDELLKLMEEGNG